MTSVSELDELLAQLADPGAYPEAEWAGVPARERRVEVVQTHISAVFLTAHGAYKVKKPLALWGFLDYSTLEARAHWCAEEVRLNRRLAPDVYRGVVAITRVAGRLSVGGAGDAVEYAVWMRRFAEADTLERRVERGAAGRQDVERLARTLARFHAEHRLPAAVAPALPRDALGSVLRQNVAATQAFVPSLFPAAVHADVERALLSRHAQCAPRLARRLSEGRAVDGHGDVRLEHVLLEGDALSVVDCVEFTTLLRHVDAASDAAFAAMDLEAHGRSDLAEDFRRAYLRAAGDDADDVWLLFCAYRAHVRAKVDATTSGEREIPEELRQAKASSARRFLALTWALLREPTSPAPLIVLHGASGTGKSVLASALSPWLRATVVRSDVVRKSLFGLEPLARPSAARRDVVYGRAASERTYAEVLRLGLEAAAGGRPALLDATYLQRGAREAVHAAARSAGLPSLLVDLQAPPQVVRERLAQRMARGDDASDADLAVYEEQLRTAEPLSPEEAAHCLPYRAGEESSRLLLSLVEALVLRRSPPVQALIR